jgi:hypothetical protein
VAADNDVSCTQTYYGQSASTGYDEYIQPQFGTAGLLTG